MALQSLLQNVIHNGIHGDFVECGVWRGGSSIFARATLYAMGDNTRKVHLVDSFKVRTLCNMPLILPFIGNTITFERLVMSKLGGETI